MIILEDNELTKLGIEQKVIDKLEQNEDYLPFEEEESASTMALLELASSIKSLAEKTTTSPEINFDTSNIAEAIAKVQETQTELIKALAETRLSKREKRVWDFSVLRDMQGNIKSIKAESI